MRIFTTMRYRYTSSPPPPPPLYYIHANAGTTINDACFFFHDFYMSSIDQVTAWHKKKISETRNGKHPMQPILLILCSISNMVWQPWMFHIHRMLYSIISRETEDPFVLRPPYITQHDIRVTNPLHKNKFVVTWLP